MIDYFHSMFAFMSLPRHAPAFLDYTAQYRLVRDNPVNLDSGPRYVFHTNQLNQIHFEYNNNIYAECCSCLEFIQTSNCHGGFMYINKLHKTNAFTFSMHQWLNWNLVSKYLQSSKYISWEFWN
jgi:hypothetical protein